MKTVAELADELKKTQLAADEPLYPKQSSAILGALSVVTTRLIASVPRYGVKR